MLCLCCVRAGTGSGQAVQATTNTVHGDHVQVLGTGVVGAVHDGADGKGLRKEGEQ